MNEQSAELEPAQTGNVSGRLQALRDSVFEQTGKVIVGQRETLEQILIAMFSSGHVLLVGVPGLAKTLLIRTLARTLDLNFSRIQFTPDLMPSDITGTEVIQQDVATGQREMRFIRGPVFANMILADEINRTSPKTQAALLEAMQERQVTVGGDRHPLQEPFMVLATQNPIEQEGTYPLPEALMDRFMMQIVIRYPDEAEELEIVRRTTSATTATPSHTLTAAEILETCQVVRQIPVSDHVALFGIRLARLTRLNASTEESELAFARSSADFDEVKQMIQRYVRWGAGPRASQFLILAGKARAALDGRQCVAIDDLKAVALPVMRHRIRTNFQASSDGVDPDQIIQRLVLFLDKLNDTQGGIDNKLFGSPGSR